MIASSALAVLKILFGCCFAVAVSLALGRLLLQRWAAWGSFSAWERPPLAFGIGSAWLSLLLFVLSAAQLVYPPVLLLVGALILVASFYPGARKSSVDSVARASPPLHFPPFVVLCFSVIAACYAYLYLLNALAPEITADSLAYHLALVDRYLRGHGFARITTDMYAALSQGLEMLFVFAVAFGGYSAAKLTHFAFLAATILLLLAFGRRFRVEGAAATAAVFYACSPVVGMDGTCSYNDCGLAFFIFLMFYLLLWWDESRAPGLLPAIGAAAGFCYAIKYTGFLALPFALGFLSLRAGRGKRLAAMLPVFLFAAVFAVPWMLKNVIVLHNPFAPFFNRFFPNPYFHVSLEQVYGRFMRHYRGIGEHSWSDYLRVPWELTVKGEKLEGLAGPLFLLAPLALFSLRQRLGRRLCAAAVIFALPWLANIGTRFLIPSLLFVSLAMALAIWQLPARPAAALAVALASAHALSSWPPVLNHWNHREPWRLGLPPLQASFRIEPEAAYLSRVSPDYGVARMVEREVPPGARVFSPFALAQAYTSRDVLIGYQCALCENLMDVQYTPVLPDYGPVLSLRFEWPRQDLTGIRLVQTGSEAIEMWSIHEIYLFSEDGYVAPEADWRLRARPNPWEASYAMDGNLATRWRSWWPLYPGMFFEIDFPRAMPLRAAEMRYSADEWKMVLRMEGRSASGAWHPLAARMARTIADPPRARMKRLATAEIKSRGIAYLLGNVNGEGANYSVPDMHRNPAAWGLREIARTGDVVLFQIE